MEIAFARPVENAKQILKEITRNVAIKVFILAIEHSFSTQHSPGPSEGVEDLDRIKTRPGEYKMHDKQCLISIFSPICLNRIIVVLQHSFSIYSQR